MGRRTGTPVWRDGAWYARVSLHREPPRGGRSPRHEERVYRPDGKAVTEAFARSYAARLQARYDDGTWTPGRRADEPLAPAAAPVTVNAWVDAWLSHQRYPEAPKDRARVKAWLPRTALGTLPLVEVTPRTIAAWLGALRALPSPRTQKPPAPRTVRNIADPVARALRAAVFEGLLGADPFAVLPSDVRPSSADVDPAARSRRRLTRAEVEAVLSDPATPDDRAVLYAILLLTGARLGEAVALRWQDVQEDKPLRRVVIAEQWHQRLKTRAPTKTRAVREVPCHPLLTAALDWWRARWPEWYGREPEGPDLIVPARAHRGVASVGGARRQASVYTAWQSDLAGAAIAPHRVHDTRATFISLCSDAGLAGDVAERWTHVPAGRSARHVYLTPSWERQCAEMLRLTLTLHGRGYG